MTLSRLHGRRKSRSLLEKILATSHGRRRDRDREGEKKEEKEGDFWVNDLVR